MSNDNSGDGAKFMLYRYTPSLPAAAIFTALFFLVTLLHTYQLLRTRTWIFIPFVIGGFFESVGYIGVRLTFSSPKINQVLWLGGWCSWP
jgi:hypothetical protein